MLYDLERMVAAVKYCSFHYFAQGTVWSSLGLLKVLGAVGDEAWPYQGALQSLIDSNVRQFDPESSQKLVDLWRSTDPDQALWIETRDPKNGKKRYRLVEKARTSCLDFLAEYNYTEEQVKAAYDAHRAQENENRKARAQERSKDKKNDA